MNHLLSSVLASTTSQLEQSGIASARLDARLLLAHALGMTREEVMLSPHKTLNSHEISIVNALVARRAQHEPIAYITGKKEFWSLDFCVTRDTLIPRPDSETLVEAALKRVRHIQGQSQERAKPLSLLDIGTGTGCLLIALLKELPGANGIGLDNNERALRVAKENARRLGVAPKAEFIQSHWCDALRGKFDLIVSNPPYIAAGALQSLMPDVARFEPHAALIAGEDGLDAYRYLSPQVAHRLESGGYVLFEVGEGQAKKVSGLLEAQGLQTEAPEKDLAGIARCVIAKRENASLRIYE